MPSLNLLTGSKDNIKRAGLPQSELMVERYTHRYHSGGGGKAHLCLHVSKAGVDALTGWEKDPLADSLSLGPRLQRPPAALQSRRRDKTTPVWPSNLGGMSHFHFFWAETSARYCHTHTAQRQAVVLSWFLLEVSGIHSNFSHLLCPSNELDSQQ